MADEREINNSEMATSIIPQIYPSKDSDQNENKKLELLTTGKWADCTIICKNGRLGVHRSILYGHSPFLDIAMAGNFEESSKQRLKLPKEDVAVVWIILVNLYLGFTKHIVCTDQQYTNSVMAFQLADYLLMPKLRATILKALAGVAKSEFVLAEWDEQKFERMLEPYLVPVLDVVFGSSGFEDLRSLYAWVLTHLNNEVNGRTKVSDGSMRDLTKRYSELGWYLFRAQQLNTRQETKCFECGREFTSILESRHVIVKVDDWPEWVSCCCQFRGYCALLCEAEDRIVCYAGARCQACMNPNIETPSAVNAEVELVWSGEGYNGKIKQAEG